jgi:hypothetical protein
VPNAEDEIWREMAGGEKMRISQSLKNLEGLRCSSGRGAMHSGLGLYVTKIHINSYV